MRTISESLSILSRVDATVAWKSQAAISLLIHRVQGLVAQPSRQVWFLISPHAPEINVTRPVLEECLRTLYAASDGELLPFRVAMNWVFQQFRVLPYVHSLPNEDLPCHTYLIQVSKNLEYTLHFYSYVWTGLLVRLSRDRGSEDTRLQGSRKLSAKDCLLLVIASRHHALKYVQLFPNDPLIPESGDRVQTHVTAYVESCGRVQEFSHIKTYLNIGRKLLAIERDLDCPGISLVMFLTIQSLAQMPARDLCQVIQLLGLFRRFPLVMETAYGLSSDIHVYQKRYIPKI